MPYHTITFYSYAFRALLRDKLNSKRLIDSYRGRCLKSLLQFSRNHTPFQRDRLTNVDLNDIDLEAIPPTTKSVMMESFNATIAKGAVTLEEVLASDTNNSRIELPILHNGYIVHKSSGTSGKPSYMVCGIRDWAILRGSAVGRMTRDWVTLSRAVSSLISPVRVAIIAAEHAHSMTWQAARSSELWSKPFVTGRFFPVADSIENVAASLNEFRPEYMHAYPTFAEMLARYRLDGGPLKFEPGLISVGSEALTEMARQAIAEAFPRSILVDHYGMTEALPLSTQCRHGHKHINTDYVIVEPRNAEGGPSAPNEMSDHVLVTNLINYVQPIIRYRVDDSVRIIHEPCSCGSVLPRVDVFSRKGSQIHLRSDRGTWQMLSPPIVVDTMLKAKGVAQFQVIHVRQNELEVKFIPQKGTAAQSVAASIKQQFDTALARLGCTNSVTTKVEQVDSLQRTATGGKLIQTISLVPEPQRTSKAAA